MRNKLAIFLSIGVLCASGCSKGYRPNDYDKFANLPVYSDSIKSVEYNAMVTGRNAPVDTVAKWKIGGTDLGFPYYDSTSNKMFYAFGDTFPEPGKSSAGELWRSNILGHSTDYDLSDGITFDKFSQDKEKGYAGYIIKSEHNQNGAGGERTAIPTGGIVINGVQYMFYMSITEWLSVGWDCNFCAVYKSTDGGETFSGVNGLYWCGNTYQKRANAVYRCNTTYEETANHINDNFMQIFPYQIGEYVYIMGIPSGRFGGAKLGRVLATNIELFNEYEYYTGKDVSGNPVWVKGTAGLSALIDNDKSYVVEPQVGEPGISYSTYFGKHMLSYYTTNKIVFRLSDNMIDWSDYVIIATSHEFEQLYGGFTHQKFEQNSGKIQYFLVSQYYVEDLGDNQYNVKLLKVTYK